MINLDQDYFRTFSSSRLIDPGANAVNDVTIAWIRCRAMRQKYKPRKLKPAPSGSIRAVLSILVLCGTAGLPVPANSLERGWDPANARSYLGVKRRIDLVATRRQIPNELLERSTPQFAFVERGDSPALVFCRLGTLECQHHPAILIHDQGAWRCLEMSSELYEQS